MRQTLAFLLLILSLKSYLVAQTPVVPSNIEIAGIKLKLTEDARRTIQKDVNALRASDKYFRIKLDRVNLYFPTIERILKEEGVPEVIKFLSVQESALISDAVSSSDAVGYWQFKDFTAREVGLRVDNKIDERKNIASATRGAAKYFKRNNFYFNNWIYAVSAYQAGAGGAKKYVDKANYGADKMTITGKTHWYVLRFIAHVIAFQDEIGGAHSQGQYLMEHQTRGGETLKEIADQYSVDLELLKEYNKWLKTSKVPEDRSYTIIIPKTGNPPKNLQARDDKTVRKDPIVSKPVYPEKIVDDEVINNMPVIKLNGRDAVISGPKDNIKTISQKTGISERKLIKYNDLSPTGEIKSNQIYYLRKKRSKASTYYHVVLYSESLWEISQKYGIKLSSLRDKNRISGSERLKPGRVLWLKKSRPKDEPIKYVQVKKPVVKQEKKQVVRKPIEKPTTDPVRVTEVAPLKNPEPQKVSKENLREDNPVKPKVQTNIEENYTTHVVTAGETLWSISKIYNVTVNDLKSWNHIKDGSPLSIGQELQIQSSISSQEKKDEKSALKTSNAKIHEVKAGESLWAIAKKYEVSVDDLKSWNNLNQSGTINPGQKLQLSAPEQLESVSKKPDWVIYVVRGGDTLTKIANAYGMTVSELMSVNNLTTTALSVGDELKVLRK